jgi:bacteriophage HK97-gp10 putative tail-component
MAVQATFEWYGDAVGRAAIAAAEEAAAAIVDAAVEEAQRRTPVETGEARDSIYRENDGAEIAWGFHVDHGFFIEVGANGRPGVYPLRGAADVTYPRLQPEAARRFRYGV